MPIDYVIMDKGSFVYARGRGALTEDDLIAHERQLVADSRVKRGYRQLLDFRWIFDDRVGEGLLSKLHEVHAKASAKVNGARYAVVAHSAHWFRLGNAYPGERYGMTWIVFNCPSTACIWLGSDHTRVMDAWSLEVPVSISTRDVPALTAMT